MRGILTAALLLVSSAAYAQQLTGEQIGQIYGMCQDAAFRKCPPNNTTIYCRTYVPGFIKMCLMKNNVPPDYIMMLTMPQ